MEKFTQMAIMMDMYGGLLTEKQRDVMDLYYNYDLSLSEIAEHYGISRQGVHDLIKRGEQTLISADKKIGMFKRWVALRERAEDIISDIDGILKGYYDKSGECPQEIRDKLVELKDKIVDVTTW